ncbi:MAG: ABC transporter ATP-binding protein [Myxococcales bacterium]|jgi:iron complex transport system ATP-binding protein|nr:MAG: ABC transporter ATP-binding protein [Myxococcales bacterium]
MRSGDGHLAIRARQVGVTLGGRTVLRGIDLEAKPGEVLALLGPNGAGKSTLLKALAGLLPYEGRVEIDDVDVADLSPRKRAKQVSYVPQRSLLRSALSVEEVVALGRYVHGGSFGGMSKNDKDAIDHALETAHADVLRDRVFTQLSVGEQQRVLLARALASDAPIVLLDEPTAALDVGEGLAVLRLIRTLAARNHTLIVVLHDLADARSTTDRALLMKEGRVVEQGPTRDVVSAEPIRVVYGVRLIENARIGFETDPERGAT